MNSRKKNLVHGKPTGVKLQIVNIDIKETPQNFEEEVKWKTI